MKTMTLLQKHKNNKRKYFWIAILGIAVLLIFLSKWSGVTEILSRGTTSVATPFLKAELYALGQGGSYITHIKSKKDLREENKNLRDEITTLRMQFLSRELLLQENRELKEILGRGETPSPSLLGVVLAKPNRSPYDTLLIDVGESHGVVLGDWIMAYGNIAIGTVDSVYKNTSRIKLFSSPGEEIDVLIGDDSISTVARGIGGGNFKIEIPRGIDVKEGDIISLPSLNATIIGVIETIKVQPADSFQTILFKSPVNMFELKWVLINQ